MKGGSKSSQVRPKKKRVGFRFRCIKGEGGNNLAHEWNFGIIVNEEGTKVPEKKRREFGQKKKNWGARGRGKGL